MPEANELSEIIIHVLDLPAELAFYRDLLGLRLIPADPGDGARTRLDAGACTLALDASQTPAPLPGRMRLVFRVPDVIFTRKDLLARGVQLGPLYEPAPGWLACDGSDPEGNPFSLQSSTDGAVITTTTVFPTINVPNTSSRRVWTV